MKRFWTLFVMISMMLFLFGCGSKEEKVEVPTEEGAEEKSVVIKDKDTVEITMDNWQDYFEIRKDVTEHTNDFDEVEEVFFGYSLFLKDEYADQIIDADVDIGFVKRNPFICPAEYNTDTGEVLFGNPYTQEEIQNKSEYLDAEETDEDTVHMGMISVEEGSTNLGSFYGACGDGYFKEGNTIKCDVKYFPDIEITRIRGTITIGE